jgi:hypothetical protein
MKVGGSLSRVYKIRFLQRGMLFQVDTPCESHIHYRHFKIARHISSICCVDHGRRVYACTRLNDVAYASPVASNVLWPDWPMSILQAAQLREMTAKGIILALMDRPTDGGRLLIRRSQCHSLRHDRHHALQVTTLQQFYRTDCPMPGPKSFSTDHWDTP